MIYTTSERLNEETTLFVSILVFMSSWNFKLSLVEHEKSFITSGPDFEKKSADNKKHEKLHVKS